MPIRFLAWLSTLSIAAIAAYSYGQVTVSFDTPSVWRVGWFALLGVSGFLSVFLFPQFRSGRAVLLSIWIPAVVLRSLLLPAAVSDDVNRYLFEGKLVRSGISPFAQTADAKSIANYRDAYWSMMNHKNKPTAYPPLTQLIFAAIGAVSYKPLAYKFVFVLADLLSLGAVLKLLERRGLSMTFSGFYSLNPVILTAFAGEAHFDSLMVAAMMWGVYVYETGRSRWAAMLISIATGIKWITLPLIPFFLGKRVVFNLLIIAAVVLVPVAFFFDSIQALFHGLFVFGKTRNFNGLFYEWLLYGINFPRSVCNSIVLVVFASIILWRWMWRMRAPLDAHMRWILGALIVVSPTVHFWYLAWIIPLLCLRPSLPWLVLSITSGSYFFVWFNASGDAGWLLKPWQEYLFWGPFALVCVYEVLSTRGRVLWPNIRSAGKSKPSVAVVIPTLNASTTIKDALSSVSQQAVAVSEVVVVDAESADSTVQIVENSLLPVKILFSERGRGVQIQRGIEASRADWVIIMHADTILASDAVACLLKSVEGDRSIIGGAFGQRFNNGRPELLLIELLNDLRGLFTRTAFGDQVQFFHRETAMRQNLMPKQLLMEDVESSWRTREHGGFLFLNQPCRVNHYKWRRGEWFKRFLLVIKLVTKYRSARMKGRISTEELSKKLYLEYYPTNKS